MTRNMPKGVTVAPLWRRAVACLIEALVPAALYAGVWFVGSQTSGGTTAVLSIVAGLLGLGWGLLLWWGYATRSAGVGYQLMGLQLVRLSDGKPIGWGRYFLRQLVFSAISATVVGFVALLIFLVIQERRQGWHDLAAKSVAISAVKQRAIATTGSRSRPRVNPASATVSLPPHLVTAAFDGSSTAGVVPADPQRQAQSTAVFGGSGVREQSTWQPPIAPGQAAPGQPGRDSASRPPVDPITANRERQAAAAAQQVPQPPAQQPAHQPAQQQSPGQAAPAQQQTWPPAAPAQPSQPQQANVPQLPPITQQPVPQRAVQQAPVQQAPVQAPPVQSAPSQAPVVETTGVRRWSLDEPEDDGGSTRMVPRRGVSATRPGNEGWLLQLDDGRRVSVGPGVLIGRNPSQPATEPQLVLVSIGQGGNAVSKVHLMVGADQRGLFVVDRGSTNGTAMVNAQGELQPCPPGVQIRCSEGQQVSFGDRSLTVLRTPAVG